MLTDVSLPKRKRLPNRRPAITETLEVEGQRVEVTVGFAPESGAVREVFLAAGMTGSMLDSLLADAAVSISVALQHGVSPAALAKSVGRFAAAMNGQREAEVVELKKSPA